ncbi:MAG: hypothetical protein ACQEUT_18100 [Bacillota bacterium]
MQAVLFNLSGDYKTEFHEKASALIELNIENRDERIRRIDELCESYTVATRQKPDSYQLVRLADYILKEELTDKDSNKSKKVEYNFHSEDQELRRDKKETALGKLEHSIDVDGKRRGNSTRNRNSNEKM